MTVCAYGVFGKRSPPHSKNGLITTLFGVLAAESSSLCESGSPKSYENGACPHSTWPATAFAYGSSSSLLGLNRLPFAGSYGPCTR